MSKIIFIFNSIPTIIQCNEDDLMENICQKFANKINIQLNNLFFLYDGKEINLHFTFNEQAKENDRQEGKMNILVYSNLDDNKKKRF